MVTHLVNFGWIVAKKKKKIKLEIFNVAKYETALHPSPEGCPYGTVESPLSVI